MSLEGSQISLSGSHTKPLWMAVAMTERAVKAPPLVWYALTRTCTGVRVVGRRGWEQGRGEVEVRGEGSGAGSGGGAAWD